MKKVIKTLPKALYIICLMSSCVQESEYIQNKGESILLQITKESFIPADNTRATDTGYMTSFVSGDQIGVFAIAADGTVLDNNIPYQYSGSMWTPVNADNTVHHFSYTTVTYLAYYPYSVTMNSAGTEAEIVNRFTPNTDQSTQENYTKSDLIVGTGTLSGLDDNRTLSISLKHRMAMIEFTLQGETFVTNSGYEYSTPVFTPQFRGGLSNGTSGIEYKSYKTTGVHRIIVKPGNVSSIAVSYNLNNAIPVSYTADVSSSTTGKYYKYNIKTGKTQDRELQLGDYYYNIDKSGYILPNDRVPDNIENCIGIIAIQESELITIGSYPTYNHAAIAALQNNIYGSWSTCNNAIQNYSTSCPLPDFPANSGWYMNSLSEIICICSGRIHNSLSSGWDLTIWGTSRRSILDSYITKAGGIIFKAERYWSAYKWNDGTPGAAVCNFSNGQTAGYPQSGSIYARPIFSI